MWFLIFYIYYTQIQTVAKFYNIDLDQPYKELSKEFWGQHLWARGYFEVSSGNVTDEIIKEYIQNQDLQEKTKTDNFEIS